MGETNLNDSSKPVEGKTVAIVVGFMIFAQFFGAGNLLFPPFLGFIGGSEWLVGFVFFFTFDVILGICGLAASGKFPEVEIGAYYRPGRTFMLVMGAICLFITGPLVVQSRTALTSYEVFLKPVLAGGFENVTPDAGLKISAVIFLIVYLGLATILAIRPSKVVDIIGKFLTPCLLAILVVIIVIGLVNMGSSGIRPGAYPTSSPSLIAFGVAQGLQTFDGPTGTLVAIIIIVNLVGKGITKPNEQTKTIIKSGFVAAICLVVIYLGLGLLGAFYSNDPVLVAKFGAEGNIDQTWLLNYILSNTLGFAGTIIFGIAILLATFTTTIGSLGIVSQFYSNITNGKIKYEVAVFVGAGISTVVAIILSTTVSGVQTLLNLTLPFLIISMPITVVLIILNLFSEKIKNDNVFRGAALGAGIWGLASGIAYIIAYTIGGGTPEALAVYGSGWYNLFFGPWNFIYTLTGDLGYIIPGAIGAIIGALIKKGGYSERPYLREHAGDYDFDYLALKKKKEVAGQA
ncbi:MAG: branched-chain amino acid transport system II carrier protein [Clostridiales Family XIII bacterium]|jgi:LIVCS family branched-chain amino acid:cation transporter|nr:branched-chain amino acid transport system II carrier protein [Clostridiales Family XIII bacterium]